MVCPHYDKEKSRRPTLIKMVKNYGGVAIALENCSAIEVIDDTYRIITSKAHAKAYKIFLYRKKIVRQQLEVNKQYKSLETLFTRAN